jgi:hypothetical protein
MESVFVVRADEKLTAFVELEAAILQLRKRQSRLHQSQDTLGKRRFHRQIGALQRVRNALKCAQIRSVGAQCGVTMA